jgi:hypothetical protein
VSEVVVNTPQLFAKLITDLSADYAEHKYLVVDWRTGKQRTPTQNAALHLWCEWVASTLNDTGLEMQVMTDRTKSPWVIPWTKHSVKESIWKPVQEAMTGHESTIDAERPDYSAIQQVIHRRMAQTFGITLPEWPKKREGAQ